MGTSQSEPADTVASKRRSLVKPRRSTEEMKSRKFSSEYKLGEILGEGTYSLVKRGMKKKDRSRVSVKIYEKKDLDDEAERVLRREYDITSKLNYVNIVTAVDFFEEDSFLYIVLEYLEGGELFDRIIQRTCFAESDARALVVTLLKTIKYCHDNNVVHRDIKPENFLYTSQADDADVRLSDFGNAIVAEGLSISDEKDKLYYSNISSLGYFAPEILLKKKYGKPCDMWSFGAILYTLLGGYPPFHDEVSDDVNALGNRIVHADYEFHADYWATVSDDAKDLISKLLTVDVDQRLTVDQALKHKWCIAAEEQLAARNLDSNLKQLKSHQKLRKLKAAVRAVIAVNRMNTIMDHVRGAATELNLVQDKDVLSNNVKLLTAATETEAIPESPSSNSPLGTPVIAATSNEPCMTENPASAI